MSSWKDFGTRTPGLGIQHCNCLAIALAKTVAFCFAACGWNFLVLLGSSLLNVVFIIVIIIALNKSGEKFFALVRGLKFKGSLEKKD